MTTYASDPQASPRPTPARDPGPAREPVAPAAGYEGEVVYMYAFDVAYEMIRKPVQRVLGQAVAEFSVGNSKRAPRQFLFYRPQTVRLPVVERAAPNGPLRIERIVKLLPIGAISITIR